MLKATVQGLKELRRPEDVAAARGLTINQVLPVGAKVEEEQPEPVAVPVAEVTEEQEETESGEGQDQASS
jgi:hypothetical protein